MGSLAGFRQLGQIARPTPLHFVVPATEGIVTACREEFAKLPNQLGFPQRSFFCTCHYYGGHILVNVGWVLPTGSQRNPISKGVSKWPLP